MSRNKSGDGNNHQYRRSSGGERERERLAESCLDVVKKRQSGGSEDYEQFSILYKTLGSYVG